MYQVLGLLTDPEVKAVVPRQAVVPRTFVLKPGTVLFLGALGRIDYLQVSACSHIHQNSCCDIVGEILIITIIYNYLQII